MTDEEMAKDYAQTECCNSCTDSCKKNKCKMYCNVRNAVLYGLKAGKDMAEADIATIAYMLNGIKQSGTRLLKVIIHLMKKAVLLLMFLRTEEKLLTTIIF